MAKVLWLGDAGCDTGFARVTHSIGERLIQKYGHDVHVLATNYDGDHVDTPLKLYRPNKMLPNDVYGQARFVEMLYAVEPDVVVILNDPHVVIKFLFMNNWDEDRILLRHRPIIAYMPVDSEGYPEPWNMLSEAVQPVVMASHGLKAFPSGRLVYHGVSSDFFRPVSEGPLYTSTGIKIETKSDAKKAFGYDPDSFLVLRVDRNSLRKDFADTWRALVPVMKKYSDIHVHLHCQAKDEGADLRYLLTRDPDTEERFHFPGNVNSFRGLANEDLAVLYNAADLFVSTSMGEGFGLTIAEAMSTGLPVIATDFSATSEVVGDAGVLIPPGRIFTAYAGVDMRMPQVELFTEQIERLYLSRGARRDIGERARKRVQSMFSWDKAADSFDELIKEAVQASAAGSPRDAETRGRT